ncbi:MAG TPA: zinc-dependent metalloprotease [Chitinophagaceae bacterium]|nr:zinc-dependent metalloprotease [Chitinophagaceae bacterium]
MQFLKKHGFILLLLAGCSLTATAQNNGAPRPDTTRRPGNVSPGGPSTGPKAYKDVITAKAVSDAGMFTIHKVEEKYFFEIPDSMLYRDILVVNRLSKAGANMRVGGFAGFAGDDISRNVIQFQRGPNNKIFLRTISFAEYTKDSTSSMYSAVVRSNVQAIAASFDIKALGRDSSGVVIDMTDYVSGDNDILFFSSGTKSTYRIGSLQSDKSYIENLRSFPINIEIKTVKTYSRMPAPPTGGFGGSQAAPGGNLTVEINSSLVLLPKVPMQPRYYDKRVGYFATGYTDYDANPQGVEDVIMVKRWRLEPKPEDQEKYKRGELVEPQKPIIFYIDPATPKKWIPYLIQGVNDWQAAFEKAGFKNAIMGKMAPTKAEDSTWSLDDARNSAIVYKPSNVANASGPSIADPRSGEIMESHINWYHNIMSLLRDWYFIQCAPSDLEARKMVFDDELMGQLIRFVSSHEVGHTLGLRHNFGSSSTVPVEKLRDKAWVEANGHTPSIMDYARFNYVAQPEDKIGRSGLFPRIGDYDHWAIEWGYRLFPEYKTADAEKGKLNAWIMDKLKNPRLWWGDGEANQEDSRNQTEDLGDDAMKAGMYGIKNLQRIVPNLLQWTREENKDYAGLENMYEQVTGQFQRYMVHIARNVGGQMLTPKMVEQSGPVYEMNTESKQREAVDFLNKNIFATPTWLLNNDIFNRTGLTGTSVVGQVQDAVISRLLNARVLGKLTDAEAVLGNSTYQVTELLADLKKGIFTELTSAKPVDIYRRNLQKSYVSSLINLLAPVTTTMLSTGNIVSSGGLNDKADAKSIIRAYLTGLRAEISGSAARSTDNMTKYHLQDLAERINKALNPNK